MTPDPFRIARAQNEVQGGRVGVYYNEIDPYCAAWLQNLMDAGHIPQGVIDTRSIEDVLPDELAGFTQCHFFAGLGGWAYALQLAGWGTRPVWTGSCPCQPFSAAGKGAGFADERHLWPAWQHLIAQCRPAVVFGEQVASKAVDPWIDLVHADLEGMGYAFGCVPFPSAVVGAPHIRDRTYWVAHAGSEGVSEQHGRRVEPARFAAADGFACRLADADRIASEQGRAINGGRHQGGDAKSRPGLGGNGLPDSVQLPERVRLRMSGAGDWAGLGQHGMPGAQPQSEAIAGMPIAYRPGPTNGLWQAADWLACTDGKWRPVEPGTFPLAHGIPNRVGRLRAYGNSINPHQAAEFVLAYAEARGLMDLEHAA